MKYFYCETPQQRGMLAMRFRTASSAVSCADQQPVHPEHNSDSFHGTEVVFRLFPTATVIHFSIPFFLDWSAAALRRRLLRPAGLAGASKSSSEERSSRKLPFF